MGKAGIGIISLIAGLVLGAVGGGSLIGGSMAGAGVATGLSGGICSTVQAAQEFGYLSDDQVDQVLTRAASDLSGNFDLASSSQVVGSSAACKDVMAKLSATG